MSKQNRLIDTEKLIVARRLGGRDMGNKVKGIKRYKLTVIT